MTTSGTRDLYEQLARRYSGSDDVSIELLDSTEPVINVTRHDYGEMQIQIAASGSQIFVSTVLVDAQQVRDRAAFNEACMRINPINPLSNLGLTTVGDRDTYIVFGELSTASGVDEVDEEISVLVTNTLDAVEALKSYFV